MPLPLRENRETVAGDYGGRKNPRGCTERPRLTYPPIDHESTVRPFAYRVENPFRYRPGDRHEPPDRAVFPGAVAPAGENLRKDKYPTRRPKNVIRFKNSTGIRAAGNGRGDIVTNLSKITICSAILAGAWALAWIWGHQ